VDGEHQGSTRSSKHQGRGAHAAVVPEREEQRQREGSNVRERGAAPERSSRRDREEQRLREARMK